jgi:DNA-binding NarL/FixJ family response regulator
MSNDLEVAVLSASPPRRDRIAALLNKERGVACAGAATSIAELGRLTPMPDAVVIDVSDAESLETLLQSDSLAMPFVVLCDELVRDIAVRALLAGSAAILERDPAAKQLLAAVRAAVNGLSALSPPHAATLMDPAANAAAPRSAEWIQPLTPRELQILHMLSDGLPNKSIAAELQISEHTAKFHVSQILAKLDAESRTEAVTIGIRHGLVMV